MIRLYIDTELATTVFSGLCAVVDQYPTEAQERIVELQHDLIHAVKEEQAAAIRERAAALTPDAQTSEAIPAEDVSADPTFTNWEEIETDPEKAAEVEKEKENVQL